ncbi:MAG: hypothetical protein FLDDKLPJ_00302 [Phycisphaerae bacterium]|nr:hypothetical protein [Phycisphaerae bacterium]
MTRCPDEILRLIERFEHQSDRVRSDDYNETQLRIDFVNPMFAVLGWDIDNRQGFAEQYREVVHEDRVRVAGQTKAPDYSFRVGGQRKFFLEAKKPAVDIKGDWEPAYQLRRYAWSAKLACSLLTNFEALAVYDTRIRPRELERASTARREFISFTEYESRWEFIEGTFSKTAVLRGDFDRYCESRKGRGAQEFDETFLTEIEEWRKNLAASLARCNGSLDAAGLNFAVQRIIDRILFLRIAEDRGTETIGQLQALLSGPTVYPRLFKLFRDADARYNSGLFHFHPEKGRDEAPDTLTPTLDVEDKTLKEIIKALYYPASPYEFTVVSADILGSVYERFLGKVISLTPARRIKVEDKPEVRKAGGVYYTPIYIVDYIVKNTVGRLLDGKAPKETEGIRILDPACGSGSFLIGAYQFLLDWYLQQYTTPPSDPAKLAQGKKAVLRPTRTGGWALTIAERKRILVDHIYGVDIDSQAVEVTKLNLLLKCLEGETSETLGFAQRLFRERALPDLGRNIQCGNSLIGTDIIGTDAWQEMSEDERRRINPFDYERAFPQVFPSRDRKGAGSSGGFDAVIGNPPYGALFGPAEDMWFGVNYKTYQGAQDVYVLFMERAQGLLRGLGLNGFIVPSAWLGGPRYQVLRQCMLVRPLRDIILLPFDVFHDAYVDTLIFVTSAGTPDGRTTLTYSYPKKLKLTAISLQSHDYQQIDQARWLRDPTQRIVLESTALDLIEAIRAKHSARFAENLRIRRGVLFDKTILRTTKSKGRFPYFTGDVYRYEVRDEIGGYIPFDESLKERPREFDWFEGDRLLLRRLVNRQQRLMAGSYTGTAITNKNLYTVLPVDGGPSLSVLLGVINSRLISFVYVKQVTQAVKDDFAQVTIKDFGSLPFPAKASGCDELGALVSNMLSLHKRQAAEKNPNRREQLQREIDASDRQIDQLVYQLYGLTKEEIKIVEEATR